jgi:hypothetical protein
LVLLKQVQVLFSSSKEVEKVCFGYMCYVEDGCSLSEKWKSEKIGVTALCRISAKGGEGLYLYIPKNFADAYGILGAEFAEVQFRKLFRVKPLGSDETAGPVDLRSRSKKKIEETSEDLE